MHGRARVCISFFDELAGALEYRIGSFGVPGDWCDGVVFPRFYEEEHTVEFYAAKRLAEVRQIEGVVLHGKSGQEKFQLTMYLGPKTVAALLRDESLVSCIPAGRGWVRASLQEKVCEIWLD